MTFFVAWSQTFSPAPIPTQTFTLNTGQERQFVDWYTNADTLAFARANPGQLYIIGDEPDQYWPPEEYAPIYYAGVQAVRAVDPTARFSPAGFAEANPYRTKSTVYDQSWDDAHSTGYAQKFCDEYARLYGQQPPVAEWRFHEFALTTPVGEIGTWWARVDRMAAWSIAHGAKLYLGSWGFLGWNQPTEVLQRQMQVMMERLESDSRIVGAAWWSLGPWEDSTHPLMRDGKLTPLGQTYTRTVLQTDQGDQMTNTERIAALEKTVSTLGDMLGLKFLGKSSEELAAALVPASALPGGRYPYILDSYQLHVAIDEMRAAPATTQPTPVAPTPPAPAPTPPPAPTGPTIAPLSASEIAAVNAALTNGVNSGMPIAAERSQIAADLAVGKYSLFNNVLIDAVKLWFYGGASASDRNALYKWLAIVDQRDPQTNAQLAPTDPRVKQVSGSASVPVPTPSPAPIPSGDIAGIVQALASTYNVYIGRNVVSVGIAPDAESKAGFQVGGEAEAEVLGISNTFGTDRQNPGEVHKNTLSICANDGGFRAIQYGNWGRNGLKRNTLNRPMSIRALMDSMGEACWSVDPLETSEKASIRLAADGRMYGQLYYERADWVAKKVVLTAFQPGWTVEIAGSSAYGDAGVKQL